MVPRFFMICFVLRLQRRDPPSRLSYPALPTGLSLFPLLTELWTSTRDVSGAVRAAYIHKKTIFVVENHSTMTTFILCIAILIAGYFLYGKYIERVFGADENITTPAITMRDDIDYMPMPVWKVYLIQFLNIAGLGPIFGAVLGAAYGPVAFIWITLGCVFGGAVHDYFSGMISIRNHGFSITEIVGMFLGKNIKTITIILTLVLMVMVGAVFITGPAKLLENLTSGGISMNMWMIIIILYYLIATLLPIDKIIGKIYPIFGFALLFMAVGIGFMMVKNGLNIPDLTGNNLRNFHSNPEKFRVFPMMFITIACGAISGFHSTQSPMMARCLVNEKLGHKVFYGAMITEGIVAMIWAAAAMGFYKGPENLNAVLASHDFNAAVLVDEIAHSMLGKVGGILAIIGVIAAPISTGDTALRSARLIAADFLRIRQIKPANRLKTSIPIFALTILLTQVRFDIIWRYFSWANQTLAMIILWTITVYLYEKRKPVWITLIPAIFMSMTTMMYIFYSPEGFDLQYGYAVACAGAVTMVFGALFYIFKVRTK